MLDALAADAKAVRASGAVRALRYQAAIGALGEELHEGVGVAGVEGEGDPILNVGGHQRPEGDGRGWKGMEGDGRGWKM